MVCTTTQNQPTATAKKAMAVTPTSLPNHARKPPDIASMAAGSANGSTLQTPHATAPVAVIAAGASRNVARQTQINEAVHHVRAGRADRVATQ